MVGHLEVKPKLVVDDIRLPEKCLDPLVVPAQLALLIANWLCG
jgi:hypothetical protein